MKIKFSILYCFFVLFLSSCSFGFGTDYKKNSDTYNEFIQYFDKIKQINNLAINNGFFKRYCEIINSWSRCGDDDGKWEKDGNNGELLWLENLQDVLVYEGIGESDFEFTVNFLKKHGFNGIGRDINSITVESSFSGLRYYYDKNEEFEESVYYVAPDKIDDHWYYFSIDFN